MSAARERIRGMFREHYARGDALGWFERVYADAGGDAGKISWADLEVNAHLAGWLEREQPDGRGRRALDVGCGLGDNAVALAARGFAVTAFDIAPTGVQWARRRFPNAPIDWQVADLLRPPAEWRGAFDLVVEIYTLQLLVPELRPKAMTMLASLVAPGGELLVICRGREPDEPEGEAPWPLTRAEVGSIAAHGLRLQRFEDFMDAERPPVRRFRVLFRKP